MIFNAALISVSWRVFSIKLAFEEYLNALHYFTKVNNVLMNLDTTYLLLACVKFDN